MISLLILSLAIVAIFNLALGIIVLVGSERTSSNILFFLFILNVFFWIMGLVLFLEATTPTAAIFWAKVFYNAAAIIAYCLLAFAYVFPSGNRHKLLVLGVGIVPLLFILSMINVSSELIQSVSISSKGNEAALSHGAYNLYIIYFFVYFSGAMAIIFAKMRKARSKHNNLQKQLFYIFLGIMCAGIFGMYFNLYLPLIGNYHLIWVGPQFSFVMAVLIFIAIIRHKLFDTRLIIARAVAYILLLVTLAVLYSIAAIIVTEGLFGMEPANSQLNTVYIGTAVLLTLSAIPLKKFFDHLTDSVFFRLEYDPQEVLNRLGDVVVNEATLHKVVASSLDILNSALKTDFVSAFVLPSSVNESMYHASNGKPPFKPPFKTEVIEEFIKKLREVEINVALVDYLEDDTLRRDLQSSKIAVIMRLETSREVLGYFLFGQKRSDAAYNSKDIQMLQTCRSELAVALQNALRFDEISRFNVTLQKEVDVATQKLRDRNRKLKELDDAKNEFIAMASHQLRTPLTSMRGYISMALEEDSEGQLNYQQRRILGEANDSSRRLAYMIDDLLNVSRLQAGSFSIDARPVHLEKVIKEELSYLHSAIVLREIKISYAMPSNFPMLKLDENKMRQVIMNFVDNAIYYSNKGDTIEVALIKTATDVQLTVKDHGIGVPKVDQPNLFTKFYRASNAKLKRPDGTGIGLFVAKKVIIAHGGSLIFKTEEGKGSTFGFSMPLTIVGVSEQPTNVSPQPVAK
jgi:signal transduction histidine kinase